MSNYANVLIEDDVTIRSQFELNRDEAARLMVEGTDQFLRDLGQRQVRFWDSWLRREDF